MFNYTFDLSSLGPADLSTNNGISWDNGRVLFYVGDSWSGY
jgi:hypothetical protein